MPDMKNKVNEFMRKNKLCPVCAAKRIKAATGIHINGAERFNNGVALTPPMGWASWNLFRHNINEKIIEEIAVAVKQAHLDELGYCYINVDDCWMSSVRDSNGRLQGDLSTFPSGIKALVEKVNALGLKFGIYTSNGTLTCEDLPSSLYHERIDAETFAEWGVEYFKYDFCHNEPIPTSAPEISNIKLAKSGETEFLTLNAEDAELRGNAVLLTDKKIAAPHTYVTGLCSGEGKMIFYDVNVEEDGAYVLTLGLHKSGKYEKYAEVVINGTDTYCVRVPATQGFNPEGRSQLTVTLSKGSNTIMIHNPVGSRMDSAAKQYRNMGKELMRATALVAQRNNMPEKPICYSICEWGTNRPWIWGLTAGNLWRTTFDIRPTWASIVTTYEKNVRLYKHCGSGNWNDPDMLEVGNGNLTDNENCAHFSLWCMMAAPLILGNDIRSFILPDGKVDTTNKTLKIITNRAAIAIDQDRLGFACRRIKTNGLADVLMKPLENKEIAVCLFNKCSKALEAGFSIHEICSMANVELPVCDRYTVYDIWKNTTFVAGDKITQSVPPHSVILYRIKAMS